MKTNNGYFSFSSYLSVVQIEPSSWLGRCSVRVDSDNEGLFAGCKEMITFCLDCLYNLLIKAAAVVCPSIPKTVPHM